jgi:beta propeller repeat protein
VVWQDDTAGNEDIFATDIWLRNKPAEFGICDDANDQQFAAVYANTVVWQDMYFGDWDIYAADISDFYNPVEFAVCNNEYSQENPDVSENLIVWQDDRNDDWDIYGYNLTTRQEFQITDNSYDQINPAVSGNVVVWQDARDGGWSIYFTILDGPEAAECISKIAGDVNGNCQVDWLDFAELADNWLECNLDRPQACWW